MNAHLMSLNASFSHGLWDAKVSPDHWRSVVSQITQGIRDKKAVAAICQAIQTIGRALAEHFPVAPDDTNELDNIIIAED